MGAHFLSQRALSLSDQKTLHHHHPFQSWYRANRCPCTTLALRTKDVKDVSSVKISGCYVARNSSSVRVHFSQPCNGAERSQDGADSTSEYETDGQNGRLVQQFHPCLEKHEVDAKDHEMNVNVVNEELHKAQYEELVGAEVDERGSKSMSYTQPDHSDTLAPTNASTDSSLQMGSKDISKLVEGVLKEAREVHGTEIGTLLEPFRRFKLHFCSFLGDAFKRVDQETLIQVQQEGDDLSHSKCISEEEVKEHNGAVLASIPRKTSRLDKINWDHLRKIWNQPSSDKIRVLVSMTNFAMSLPTFLTRTLPSISQLHWPVSYNTISFSILAPVLFGGGMIFKSSIARVGTILPRIGMTFGILWVLWGLHGLGQKAILCLKENGSVEVNFSNSLSFLVELTFNAALMMTILASLGVNLSTLFVPSVLALALAGKDVWQNHLAGFSLFMTQPFQPGQRLSVSCDYVIKDDSSNPIAQSRPGWFEGVCESVDLRYTVLRNGQTRLIIPNSRFVNQAFMIVDTVPCVAKAVTKRRSAAKSREKSRITKDALDGAVDHSASMKRSSDGNQAATSEEAN